MHGLLVVLLLAAAGDATPTATFQRLLDAMAHKDAEAARALFLPEALLFGVNADGAPTATPAAKFVERIGSHKEAWLERIWNTKELVSGPVAVVWADYDFHLDGTFNHCGVDSASLLKTAAGWKIASLSDTREKANCTPSPLGPPSK